MNLNMGTFHAVLGNISSIHFGNISFGNISSIHLFDDGLHLLESGMCILANNFICKLNYFFWTHLHHPNIHF